MTFELYDASAPVFVNTLDDMRSWLDKAAAEKDEAADQSKACAGHAAARSSIPNGLDSEKNALARFTGKKCSVDARHR